MADMGRTVDGVTIEPGLIVFTNEFRAGRVEHYRADQPVSRDGWFNVRYADGRGVLQNPERVATRFRNYQGAIEVATVAYAQEAD